MPKIKPLSRKDSTQEEVESFFTALKSKYEQTQTAMRSARFTMPPGTMSPDEAIVEMHKFWDENQDAAFLERMFNRMLTGQVAFPDLRVGGGAQQALNKSLQETQGVMKRVLGVIAAVGFVVGALSFGIPFGGSSAGVHAGAAIGGGVAGMGVLLLVTAAVLFAMQPSTASKNEQNEEINLEKVSSSPSPQSQ